MSCSDSDSNIYKKDSFDIGVSKSVPGNRVYEEGELTKFF
jgi:hypothetical protein